MPSNPVEEASEAEIAWHAYRSTGLIGIMWLYMSLAEREHAEMSFLAGYRAAIEQERSRYEGLVDAVDYATAWMLTPAGDEKEARESDLLRTLRESRAAITPSAPAEETQTADWIVRQVADAKEAIRTGPKWLQNAAAEHAARRAPAEKEG